MPDPQTPTPHPSQPSHKAPVPEILHRDDHVVISWLPGQAQQAVIAFTGIGLKLGGIQQHEFQASLDGARDVYFVTDHRRSWYNGCDQTIVTVLTRHLNQRGTTRVITLGNSMGGFGAIAFAGRLPNVAVAIAFVPQSSIKPQIAGFDRRYAGFARKVAEWTLPDAVACLRDGIRYHVILGDSNPADTQHAQRLAEAGVGTVDLHVIRGSDHKVAAHLKRSGIAMRDLISALVGDWREAQRLLSPFVTPSAETGANMQTQPEPIRNELEINLFGLQRSGNHGVVAWLIQQFPDPVVFLNNVDHFKEPYASFRFAHMERTVAVNHSARERVEKIRATPKPVLIVSYENLRLDRLASAPLMPDHDRDVGASGRILPILLLRDFFNWAASRLKLHEHKAQDVDEVVRNFDMMINLWLSYAQEFSGQTGFLPGAVRVSYPAWASDETYRAGLLGQMGITLRDNSNAKVPNVGGGSSFDSTSLTGQADKMAVDKRWEYLLQPRFAAAVAAVRRRRDAIEPLNAAIFNAPWVLD